jgi:hypothetical protein
VCLKRTLLLFPTKPASPLKHTACTIFERSEKECVVDIEFYYET